MIADCKQLREGESYICVKEDCLDIEVEEKKEVRSLPWFDPSVGKAFKEQSGNASLWSIQDETSKQ